MFGLIKKDLFQYALYLLAWGALTTLYWIDSEHGSDEQGRFNGYMIVTTGSWMLMIVIGALWTNEQQEEKNNGYGFLQTLPITVGEIVASKFAVLLILIVLYVAAAFGQLSLFPQTGEVVTAGRLYVLLCANVCLIVAALVYIGIYRYGVTIISKLIIFLIAFGVPVLATYFLSTSMIEAPTDLLPLTKIGTRIGVSLLAISGLVVYGILMQVAIKIKQTQYV